MKKLKHSKYKNTGILFEILARQITSDTIEGSDSNALEIVKNNFRRGTELNKELKLYQSIIKETFNNEYKAQEFINIIISKHRELNKSKLRREKYNLIKEIKDAYNIDDLFKVRIKNYKELASTYKLFEYREQESPMDYVECKSTLLESIVKDGNRVLNEEKSDFEKQPTEIRLLAHKLLVESFNKKYKSLSDNQKIVLRNYINAADNSSALNEFVKKECNYIKSQLSEINVEDRVVSIKINEVTKLIDRILERRVITENEILSILRYYDLLKELKRVK